MAEPCRLSFRDGRLASRKAEEAACRRFQATGWLESMVGPLGLSPQPSEQEFVSSLRSGLVLCKTINKIQPGAVPKVVANQSLGHTWDNQPLPAYQYFENVRNFLVAAEELKLPTFEASDLERDTLDAGSAAKIVDCVLALKSYYEWKQCNGGNGPWKQMKSPIVQRSAGRNQPHIATSGSLSLCRGLDLSAPFEKQRSTQNDNPKNEEKVDLLVRMLSDCMFNSKENIDQNVLDSWRRGSLDSVNLFTNIMSSSLEEQQRQPSQKDLLVERNAMMNGSITTNDHKCCKLCFGKRYCHHQYLLEAQENELVELKSLLSRTRVDFIALQFQLQNDLKELGVHIQGLSAAALGYHQAVKENRHLYNKLQELKGNIQVFCRIRPTFNLEAKCSIDYIGNDGSLMVLDPLKPQCTRKIFQFNKVFGPTATQDEVYKETQSLIRSVMDGYNVCIFAYGQTGSGKTHTMCGPSSGSTMDVGINYMALNDLFAISCIREDVNYEIRVQMVEIYNEQVRDLLTEDVSTTKLEIRNCSTNGGLILPDASMHLVQSTSDVLNMMKLGEKHRVFSPTIMNERSSRSHSVLTVHVHGKDISGSMIRSCLHLVDLAGSERIEKSEVTGDRLKEAQHINKSLSCLGDVISALAQKNSHIPYRNSKLTQLLQSSLGGHGKMLMFAHVSPESDSYQETISTLKFAQRVSTVELGAAQVNKESSNIRDLKEQIDSLKKALASKELEKNAATFERSKAATEHTPPRPQRLSIENLNDLKYGTASGREDRKVSRPKFATEHAPVRFRRLSMEGSKCANNQREAESSASKIDSLKMALASKECEKTSLNAKGHTAAAFERSKPATERTPPRPRRLSIENPIDLKTETDDRKVSKSSLSRPKFPIEHAPVRFRRLSLEGSICENSQREAESSASEVQIKILEEVLPKENSFCPQVALDDGPDAKASFKMESCSSVVHTEHFGHFSPSSCNSSCRSQLPKVESRYRMPHQQPATPEPSRNLDEQDEAGLSNKSQTRSSNTNTNTRGSHIRKSLQTIGKLIHGSDKSNYQTPSKTPTSKFGWGNNIDRKLPITSDARSRRRQSLNNIQPLALNVSRGASLGGKLTDSYSNDMPTARTPPPIHRSAKKSWL